MFFGELDIAVSVVDVLVRQFQTESFSMDLLTASFQLHLFPSKKIYVHNLGTVVSWSLPYLLVHFINSNFQNKKENGEIYCL